MVGVSVYTALQGARVVNDAWTKLGGDQHSPERYIFHKGVSPHTPHSTLSKFWNFYKSTKYEQMTEWEYIS